MTVAEGDPFKSEHAMAYVEANRERIRTLVGSVFAVAGILASAGGLLLFFLAERSIAGPASTIIALVVSLVLLVIAMGVSIVALIPGRAKPMPTLDKAADVVMTRYRWERTLATLAAVLLLASLAGFVVSFALFLTE